MKKNIIGFIALFIFLVNILNAQEVIMQVDSISKEYDENGKLRAEGVIVYNPIDEDGIKFYVKTKVGIWKYYFENGQLSETITYNLHGNKNGDYTSYYENGQLHKKGNYFNDRKTGDWTAYHINGKLAAIGTYNADKGKDNWQYYDEQGVKLNINFAEKQIEEVLNEQLGYEIEARKTDTVGLPGHKFALVNKFRIENKILIIEVIRGNPNSEYKFKERQEVELSKIKGVYKDINMYFETAPNATKVITAENNKEPKTKYSDDFSLYLSYVSYNDYVGEELVKVFKNAGYIIKMGSWND